MRAGQVLGGRYELIDVIGAGGSAVVWRARDDVLGRVAAVKVLAGRHAGDPVLRDRVRHEARTAAALTHPNIAQIYDFGETEDNGQRLPYVVMELVRGRTLADRMMAGPLPAPFALQVAAEVAAALVAAHAADLVHRDIKPANVMLTDTGAKVVDFGIAASVDPAGAPDEDVVGTPAYVAPERLTGEPVTPASDMYALGVLLYRLLTGNSPWDAETTTQMLAAHVYVEPAPLEPMPGVPGHIITMCNRCLDKDPTLRPTARDAAAQLARAAGLSTAQDRPPAAAPVPPPPPRTRRRLVVAAVAAALLASAGAGAWWFRDPDPSPGSTGAAGPSAVPPSSSAAAPVPGASRTPGTSAPAPATGRPGTKAPPRSPGAGATPAAPTATGPAPATTPPPLTQPPPTGPPPPPPPPVEQTLSSTGGKVQARCVAAGVRLTSWTATKPYKVGKVNAGPAARATASFKRGNKTVTMTVSCAGGVASTVNDES